MENKLKVLFGILIILITGCQSTPRTIDEVVPEEKYQLLHIAEQWAYKSFNPKDLEIEEFCSTKG
tara:strand:+ start:910 stop:1104 length:195 start_codon:yes stop_codon:yes gene_type:complete